MEEGKINVIAGWSFLLLALLTGLYLFFKMGDASWAKDYFGMPRAVFRVVHFHGALFSIVNILYGMTVGQTTLPSWLKTTGSWLGILGIILYPGALFLGATVNPFFYTLLLWGGLALIVAVGILVYGQLFSRA